MPFISVSEEQKRILDAEKGLGACKQKRILFFKLR